MSGVPVKLHDFEYCSGWSLCRDCGCVIKQPRLGDRNRATPPHVATLDLSLSVGRRDVLSDPLPDGDYEPVWEVDGVLRASQPSSVAPESAWLLDKVDARTYLLQRVSKCRACKGIVSGGTCEVLGGEHDTEDAVYTVRIMRNLRDLKMSTGTFKGAAALPREPEKGECCSLL